MNNYQKAAELIKNAKQITAFTGAGISVESGIPPFRGETGLWSKYNPVVLDINYFLNNSTASWKVIKEIFYDFFGKAKYNDAHKGLAIMEKNGYLHDIITQNIDNLHQEAGSKNVYEYHGTSHTLVCLECNSSYHFSDISLENLPPLCKKCNGLLKPDFIFFGEGIPAKAAEKADEDARKSDLFLVIGTTGEIMPASMIPYIAKNNGAKIIEINIENSSYTKTITDVFLNDKATVAMNKLLELLNIQ